MQIHPLGKSPVIEMDGRVISESAAIVEVLHTGSTEVLPYSYGAKKKLDAKFAGQINEWN